MDNLFDNMPGHFIPYQNELFFLQSFEQFKKGEELKENFGACAVAELISGEETSLQQGNQILKVSNGMLVSEDLGKFVSAFHCSSIDCKAKPLSGKLWCLKHYEEDKRARKIRAAEIVEVEKSSGENADSVSSDTGQARCTEEDDHEKMEVEEEKNGEDEDLKDDGGNFELSPSLVVEAVLSDVNNDSSSTDDEWFSKAFSQENYE